MEMSIYGFVNNFGFCLVFDAHSIKVEVGKLNWFEWFFVWVFSVNLVDEVN